VQVNVKKTLLIIAVSVVLSLPFYSYEWNLFMHIFGAIVFMGNIIVTAVWMTLAKRSGNPDNLKFASKAVITTDIYFTTPGFVLLLLNGGILSTAWFKSGQASWIWVALGLFTISGIAWFGFLIPIQRRLARLADAEPNVDGDVPAEFYAWLKKWYRWGGIATLLPLASLVIMVLKPTFW
jgi:uncharacterized membrane protein